eukprot:TRINITY_DN27578_c0_g1_i1.p1 TRINITY_DN27578_c0_g1~~TRINITY_DN27578_c0_g1_i1.p1  ORF type:complete len:481 (+),score=84.91 TRINITY_DN27578_c0_g1_i1:134-1444(+)
MGALISAPLSALGTCLGGCCGSFMAAGCWKLAGAGQVDSERAARCVLVWLQAFTLALAALLSSSAGDWLPWSCDKLSFVDLGNFGICECRGSTDESSCWRDQVVYRMEAAGTAVFAALLIMAVSGCAAAASRTRAVGKFLAVAVIGTLLLFFPNGAITAYGEVATVSAAVFLVAQSVLLIDFAYTWNETWFTNSVNAHRREIGNRGQRLWLGAIVVSSALLFIGAVAGSISLYVNYADVGGRCINVVAMVLCLACLVVSITDWCEHGALLTSMVVMAYTAYLVCEMLSVLPSGNGPQIPVWVRLSICAVSLASATACSGAASEASASPAARTSSREQPLCSGAAAEAGAAGTASTAAAPAPSTTAPAEGSDATVDVKAFALQCAVHVAATLYVTSSLAPRPGGVTFACHGAAVIVSVLLYGWSLVAPKVLTGRDFS